MKTVFPEKKKGKPGFPDQSFTFDKLHKGTSKRPFGLARIGTRWAPKPIGVNGRTWGP